MLVLLAEEALAVETGHLVPRLNVPEHLHAGCVSICRHKLGARGSVPHPVGGLAPRPHRLAWPGPLASPPAPGMGRGRALGRALPRACPQRRLLDPPLLCLLPPSLQDDDLTRPGNAKEPLPPAHPLAPRWPAPPAPPASAASPSPGPGPPPAPVQDHQPPHLAAPPASRFLLWERRDSHPSACPSVRWSVHPRLTHTWEWPWPLACLTPGQLPGISQAGGARCPHSLRA